MANNHNQLTNVTVNPHKQLVWAMPAVVPVMCRRWYTSDGKVWGQRHAAVTHCSIPALVGVVTNRNECYVTMTLFRCLQHDNEGAVTGIRGFVDVNTGRKVHSSVIERGFDSAQPPN